MGHREVPARDGTMATGRLPCNMRQHDTSPICGLLPQQPASDCLPPNWNRAGALLSLEAGTSFVGDLDSALKATGSSLPACALPSQLGG